MRMRLSLLIVFVLLTAFAPPTISQEKSEQKIPVFKPAQVLSTVEAVYPPRAVNWGTVVVEVTVSPSAEIEDVRVIRDAPGFTAAALAAVRKWKFRSATVDGEPIRSVVPVSFSFAQPLVWRPGP